MSTILITGAGRGLGLEFTRQYLAAGWKVIATIRDPQAGQVFATLDGDLQTHILDVNNHASVDRFAKDLEGEAIDVLLNNAGILGTKGVSAEETDYQHWQKVMETNVFAPFKMATSFMPHVLKSEQKKIATVSSKMGSMESILQGGEPAYRSSKAAVNAVMKGIAEGHREQGLTCIVMHPGWVQTDMGGANADIDAVESVTGMKAVIEKASPADTGKFYNYDGSPLPW